MEITRISTLTPGGAANPIEVKVIRRWLPYSYSDRKECCYLFLDKHGDAIEAISNVHDHVHSEVIITPQSCYRVTEYICDRAKTINKTVPHNVTLRIGKAATFVPIPDVDIPSCYFNFTTYDNLHMRLNNHHILTDFIGKVVNITDILRRRDKILLKINLENPSGTFIEVTLWEEIATSFNKEAVTRSRIPVIMALTSLRVTEYQGKLQLNSTPATYIYLNPNINETKSLIATFIQGKQENAITQLNFKSDASQTETTMNRATIADLLQKNPQKHIGTRFTCIASVTNIDENRGWFYKGCTKCRRKVQPRGHTLACQDHGEISEPKHLFCLTATIEDNTASAAATFFDEAVSSFLERNCIDLVVNEGYTDPDTIPPPFHSIKGKLKIFQLQLGKRNQQNSSPFIVNQVFQFTDIETQKKK